MPATATRSPFPAGAQRLSSPRLRALNDVLPSIYAETDLQRLPHAFVDALAQLVPGESHGVVIHDRPRGQRYWHLRPAAPEHESLVPGFFANFHEFAPADYRKLTGSGNALALSDFVARPRLGRLAIYRDYYRRLGLEDDLNITFNRGEIATCAAVLRSRRGFRNEERELMNALRPHFKQAWANAATITELARASTAAPIAKTAWAPDPLELRFGLTPREAEVLLWVAQGKTNPETAAILGIRPYTVRTHLERIFTKLGVENRQAAGLRAIEVLGLPQN